MTERCTGAVSATHTGRDPRPVRLGPRGRVYVLCAECREAAARLGVMR